MTKRNSRQAVVLMQKLKAEPRTSVPSLSKARLKELIEEAVVDAYTEEEQAVGFLTMIEEHLAVPFSVNVLGVDADVEKFDVTLMAKLLPFAVVAERGKRSQSWTFVANAGASRRGMDCRLSPLASRCLVSKYQY